MSTLTILFLILESVSMFSVLWLRFVPVKFRTGQMGRFFSEANKINLQIEYSTRFLDSLQIN